MSLVELKTRDINKKIKRVRSYKKYLMTKVSDEESYELEFEELDLEIAELELQILLIQ